MNFFKGNYSIEKKKKELQKSKILKKAYDYVNQYVVDNVNYIIERHQECIAKSKKDEQKDLYLFHKLGLKTSYNDPIVKAQSKNCVPEQEVDNYAANFVKNVFPTQSQNFWLMASDECVKQIHQFYENDSEEDVKKKINELLRHISEIVQESIDASNFYLFFNDLVKYSLVRQFDCMIQPVDNPFQKQSDIVFKQILPFEIAYDRDDKQEIVGIYREVNLRVKDIRNSPDYKDVDPEIYEGKQDRDVILFKQCIFLMDIPFLNEQRWVHVLIYNQNKITQLRLLEFNPFITFCYTLPFGESRGYGKLFFEFDNIVKLEDLEDEKNNIFKFNTNPALTCEFGAILDKNFGRDRRIKPGQIVFVDSNRLNGRMVFNNIRPYQDPQPLMISIEKLENDIRKAISGERLNNDPNTTATLTAIQNSIRVDFLQSLHGKILNSFIFQIVQKVILTKRKTGVIQKEIKNFLMKDINRLPYVFSEINTDSEKGQILFEDMLDEFVDLLLDAFGDITKLNINIISPIGSNQKIENANKTLACIQTVSNLYQKPAYEFTSFKRTSQNIFENMGGDQGILLSDEESEEQQRQILQQQIMMQQMQQQTKAA